MKRFQNILAGMLFAIAFFLCTGLHAHANFNSRIHPIVVELASNTNTLPDSFSADIDSSDDDHFFYTREIGLSGSLGIRPFIALDFFLIPTYPLLIWQPPKNS